MKLYYIETNGNDIIAAENEGTVLTIDEYHFQNWESYPKATARWSELDSEKKAKKVAPMLGEVAINKTFDELLNQETYWELSTAASVEDLLDDCSKVLAELTAEEGE